MIIYEQTTHLKMKTLQMNPEPTLLKIRMVLGGAQYAKIYITVSDKVAKRGRLS